MQLIKSLIGHELVKYQHMFQNIFRSNSLASKVLGFYVREVGGNYLRMVLGDVINELLTEDCDLEIDPLKLGENSEQKQLENRTRLVQWTERFLERIMDQKLKEMMPSEVRTVASYIAQISDSLQLDTPVLIGGYIMLRFFNPAIATPDVYGLVKKGKGDHGQRNLILISKIIQNLANGVLFGQKEQYMTSLNDFLGEKISEMREYLSSVVDVDAKVPTSDANDVGGQGLSHDTLPSSNEYPKVEQYPNMDDNTEYTIEHIDFDALEIPDKDCIKLQRLLWESAPAVVAYLVSKGIKSLRRCGDFMSECVMILRRLELPSGQTDESVREKVTETFKSIISSLNGCYNEVDNSDFERKSMLYSPDPSAINNRTIYFVMNRFDMKIWNVPGYFGCFLFALCKLIFGYKDLKTLHVVFDCSLTFIGNQHKPFIATLFNCFKAYFAGVKIKNLVVLQASGCVNTASLQVQSMPYSMLRSLSKKEEYKLYDLAHWEKLPDYVTLPQTIVTEETRIFVDQSYRVIKVNSKGKHQDRLIVITPKSILNIDPKSLSIKNERLLSEIEEVVAPTSNLDIHMKFKPTTYQTLDDNGKPFFSGKTKDDIEKELSYSDSSVDIDSIFRKYVLNSVQERALLLEDLFETTVRSQFVAAPVAYKVTQVFVGDENSSVSHEEAFTQMSRKKNRETRILKFSNDHILEVDKRSIKYRLPFIAVQNVELLTGDHTDDESGDDRTANSSKMVLVKFKHEGFHRVWKLKHTKTISEDNLMDSVREGVRRVKDILKLRKARRADADKKREQAAREKLRKDTDSRATDSFESAML